MTTASVTILVDLGNSETRAELVYMGKNITITVPNRFYELKPNYLIPEEYRNDDSIVFCNDGIYLANGELVSIEFPKRGLAPIGFSDKSSQITSKYSIILLMIKAINKISGDIGVKASDINWVFNIAVLLPPFEQDKRTNDQPSGKEAMIDLIRSITQINSVSPVKYSVPVAIKEIKVLPEGVVAFTAAMFKLEDGKININSDNQKYKQGYCIVLDIGAGTTDMVVVRDGKFIMSTKETFRKGGNLVESTCRTLIRRKYNVSPSDMKEIIETGVYHHANDTLIVDDLLDEAKKDYAENVLQDIIAYLGEKDIPVQELRGVLTVGGGSLPTMRNGVVVSEPMSAPLVALLKQFSPSIEQIKLDSNPRYANLDGLHIMSTAW